MRVAQLVVLVWLVLRLVLGSFSAVGSIKAGSEDGSWSAALVAHWIMIGATAAVLYYAGAFSEIVEFLKD